MKFLGLSTVAVTASGAPWVPKLSTHRCRWVWHSRCNIVELAESVPDLSTLVAAVVAADLVDTLTSAGPFTVFAPSNDAFTALPFDSLTGLLKPENKAVLVDVLTNHVVSKQIALKDFNKVGNVTSVAGYRLFLHNLDTGFRSVCVEPAEEGPRTRNTCKDVKNADNFASNGVVHIIRRVLVPEKGVAPLSNRLAGANIVGLAQSVADLSTLVTAVVAGDLVDTLSSPGLFTVFAPTNQAFAKLPAGTVDSLLNPANKAELVDILNYHVLVREVDSSLFYPPRMGDGNFTFFTTAEGKPLRLCPSGGKPMVGPNLGELKNVVAADNFCTNGVVHVIDGVLLPSSVANDQTVRLTKNGVSFDVKEGACYHVPESQERTDQRVLCEPNGDAWMLQYKSTDGTCSDEAQGSREYERRTAAAPRGVDCSPPLTPNIVELAESVRSEVVV